MSYNKTRTANKSNEETYQQTLSRIEKIQSHLDTTPRGSRLKGKVCIITGAGSLKGIGYVPLAYHLQATTDTTVQVVRQPTCSPMKVTDCAVWCGPYI